MSFANQPTNFVGSDFINGGPAITMNSKVGTVIVRSEFGVTMKFTGADSLRIDQIKKKIHVSLLPLQPTKTVSLIINPVKVLRVFRSSA